jgi:uncharacterized membrane protein YozB (DUF420 family)
MNLILINSGMTLSLLCFYTGYYFRKKNLTLHKRFNILGVVLNLGSAIFLLAHKYLLGGITNAGIVAVVPEVVVLIHRILASISLVLMLLMAFTGITNKKEIHKKLHYFFLPLYTIIYISGLIIFQSR